MISVPSSQEKGANELLDDKSASDEEKEGQCPSLGKNCPKLRD